MSAVPAPDPTPEISDAAQMARERLHAEIERVRSGVEEMLDDQEAGRGVRNDELRAELRRIEDANRDYVKKKIRKSEKKLESSMRELEARSDRIERRIEERGEEIERRIDQVETDQEEAEWRIHDNTEQILDGLLEDVREIADRLEGAAPAPATPRIAPRPKEAVVGPLPFARRR